MKSKNRIDLVVFTDADNTLWDTNKVFAGAQLGLLEEIETNLNLHGPDHDRLEFVRKFDQEIAAKHHAGLRYPPRILCQTLALGLEGLSPKEAFQKIWSSGNLDHRLSDALIQKIEAAYFRRIGEKPGLCTGVREGLKWLTDRHAPALVVTEGPKKKVRDLISHYDLDAFVNRVIEGRKEPALYKRILRLIKKPAKAIMVGDQLDRDILPAQRAGLVGVYLPGGFNPAWSKSISQTTPDFQIQSFDQIREVAAKLVDV
ncbi:MAG: HAD family hydrolase [Rhodospirillales bacterium]